MKRFLAYIFLLYFLGAVAQQNTVSNVWVSDNGDGTFTNPILHADYSDPDVIRVRDDYYMTASSFNCVPGLPVLHSSDLVNWELINYALPKLIPEAIFKSVQHGKGVWAPCIRYHNDEYYIYYPDPDHGIYMVKTQDPYGLWSEPLMVKPGKGLIDPTPLWDDDGKAYLAYAFAGSRAGVKSMLMVCTMNTEGTRANADDVMVYDGHNTNPTVEGPKFYKRNGYYYLFAPAGGVANGWQLALRSKSVLGPYEAKIVMEQGDTDVNGPHQGAWVQTASGADWFIHFQDKGAYGRVVHLQPMHWIADWPVIGSDPDKNGIGNPVLSYKKPDVGGAHPIMTPPDTDEFNKPRLGLQWQWHANLEGTWGFPTSDGYFMMHCQPLSAGSVNLWEVSNLLLQKFPAEAFTVTTKISFEGRQDNERAGLLIMGRDYSALQLKQEKGKLYLSQITCLHADEGGKEVAGKPILLEDNTVYLRITVKQGGICTFSFSNDNSSFENIGMKFTAKEGKWIGTKLGFFALSDEKTNDAGSLKIDWIRFSKN